MESAKSKLEKDVKIGRSTTKEAEGLEHKADAESASTVVGPSGSENHAIKVPGAEINVRINAVMVEGLYKINAENAPAIGDTYRG